MQPLSKTATLRVVILLAFITLTVRAVALFDLAPHVLSTDLQPYKEAPASAGFSVIDTLAVADMIALIVGIMGLLWRRRWARMLFSVAVVFYPPTTTAILWFADPTSISMWTCRRTAIQYRALLSAREDIESMNQLGLKSGGVIRGARCGRHRTANATTAANGAIRAI